MKNKIFLTTLFFIFSAFLTSCATSITAAKQVDEYQLTSTSNDIQMEFIGYKGDTNILSTTADTLSSTMKDTYTILSPYDQWKAIVGTESLRNMGTILEQKKIATDKSFAYFGIYSLQELELYKSKTRYVTFIEVVKNKYTVEKDTGINKNFYGAIGGTWLGFGIMFNIIGAAIPSKVNEEDNSGMKSGMLIGGLGMDLGGLIPLLIAGSESQTTMHFDGIYNIYVYDTLKKEIIFKDLATVTSRDEFEGSYTKDNSSKEVVHEYYAKLVKNELLKKYDNINKMLLIKD